MTPDAAPAAARVLRIDRREMFMKESYCKCFAFARCVGCGSPGTQGVPILFYM
jgi:hypothetical protein